MHPLIILCSADRLLDVFIVAEAVIEFVCGVKINLAGETATTE